MSYFYTVFSHCLWNQAFDTNYWHLSLETWRLTALNWPAQAEKPSREGPGGGALPERAGGIGRKAE